MTVERVCRTCEFWDWDREKADILLALCRNMPPVPPTPSSMEPQRAEWPWTASHDWCGQWRGEETA